MGFVPFKKISLGGPATLQNATDPNRNYWPHCTVRLTLTSMKELKFILINFTL